MLRQIVQRIRSLYLGKTLVKSYKSYSQYLEHQKSKTADPRRREKWLGEEWQPKLAYFRQTFEALARQYFKGKQRALCLGARTGQEVQALIDIGCDAIGIDLVACPPLVIEGDVHKIPFPDHEFDFVFSNIVDHVLHPDVFVREIERVLRPGGLMLFHLAIGRGTDDFGVVEMRSSKEFTRHLQKSEIVEDRSMPEWGGGLNWEVLAKTLAS